MSHNSSLARVLFVPSDLIDGELRESFLDRRSLVVRTAQDAATALAMVEIWRPSLVVLRSNLAGTRITDVCRSLREMAAEGLPCIVLLTEELGQGAQDAIDAPCDAHLIAPVQTPQLLDTIAALLRIDRRRYPRAGLETLVQARGFGHSDGGEPLLGNSINVSEDGMLLESNAQLVVGEPGQLDFYLPQAQRRLSLRGVVRLLVDEIRLHYALEFSDVSSADRTLLRGYVDSGDR